MLKKLGKGLEKLISGIFLCYWIYTLVSVICLDRNIAHFKRSYEASNLRPVMGVIILLFLVHWIAGKKIGRIWEKIPERKYYGLLIGLSIAVFAVQMVCMQSISKPLAYDFEYLRKNAISIAKDNTILQEWYFNRCPNNQNILYVFTVLVKVFGSWQAVVVLGILMVNISVLLAAQISYRITDKKAVGIAVLMVGILLFDFSYRTFVPYTDNYSALFLMIPVYVHFNHKESKGWKALSAAAIGLGCFIKITCAILLIAGAIVIILYKLPEKKKLVKNSLLFGMVFICVFGGMTAGRKVCLRNAGLVEQTDTKWGVWHYFMMGQNENTLGGGWREDRKYSSSFKTFEERNAANRAEGFKRIANRGIRNNILFYTYKNFQNYDDGCFAAMQKTIEGEEYGDSFLEKIFIMKKPYYHLYALLEQTLWLFVLALILCGTLLSPGQNKYLLFLRLAILGVSAYTMLFEGRAKYLFMFVPIYLLMAGDGLGRLIQRWEKGDVS